MGRRRWILLVLGVVLLTACGNGGAAAPASRTPEELHTAWLAAMQQNDLPALLALISPPMPDTLVMDRLRAFQKMLKGEEFGAYTGRGPAFIRADGAQQIGLSVWNTAQEPLCYRLDMAQMDNQWKVVNWRRVERRECQAS
jgi:hypothetical protein